MAKKKIEEKTETGSYTASLKVLGTEYKSTGKTSIEAISNLNPKLARGMSILTVSNGKKVIERILPRVMTARLFATSKLIREMQLKHMAARFDL